MQLAGQVDKSGAVTGLKSRHGHAAPDITLKVVMGSDNILFLDPKVCLAYRKCYMEHQVPPPPSQATRKRKSKKYVTPK